MSASGDAPRQRALGVAAVVLPALCATGLFSGALFHGETFFLRDLAYYHRPLRAVLVGLWRASGGVPAWNPFTAFGQPFAANPNSGVFHPFSALFFLLPFEPAFQLQVILPVLIAFVGMLFLLRTMGRGQAACLAGALSWAFGGCTLSLASYLPLAFTLAFLPATMGFAIRLLRAPSPGSAAALAACVGLQCLGGAPEGLLGSGLALLPACATGLARARSEPGGGASPSRRRARGTAALLAAGLLGGLVGSVVLLPGWKHVALTSRVDADAWARQAEDVSLPPARLAELVAPHVMGHVVPTAVGWYWGGKLYGRRPWPHVFSIYPGLLASVASAIAVVHRPRQSWPWLAMGGAGLALAFGVHAGLWPALQRAFTPFAALRYPEKFCFLPVLAVAVLAASGFDVLITEARAGRAAAMALAGIGAVGAGAAAVALGLTAHDGGATWIRLGIADWLAEAAGAAITRDCAIAAATATSLAMAAWWLARSRRGHAVLALLALTAADLLWAGRELVPTMPPESLTRPPAELAPAIAHAAEGYVLVPGQDVVRRLKNAGRIVALAPPVPAQWGVATAFDAPIDGAFLGWSDRAREALVPALAEHPELVSPVLRRRSVLAVLRVDVDVAGRPARSPFELLRTVDPEPLAFSASRVATASVEVAALLELGEDAASTVTIDADRAHDLPGDVAPGDVRVVSRTPVDWRIAVGATGPQPCVVAINQTWSPHWHALLDGRPVRLVRVDGDLQAVAVPPGSHAVVLAYRDPWIARGAVASGLGILGVLALLGAAGRRPGLAPEARPDQNSGG